MILFSLAVIWLGVWAYRSKDQARAVSAIRHLGGQVIYENELAANLWVPQWLVETIGQDYFFSIHGVDLFPSDSIPADEQLEMIRNFRKLRRLVIWPNGEGGRTNAGIRRLQIHENDYHSASGGLTEDGAEQIRDRHRSLSHLSAFSAKLSDENVHQLMGALNADFVTIMRHDEYGGDIPVRTQPNQNGKQVVNVHLPSITVATEQPVEPEHSNKSNF